MFLQAISGWKAIAIPNLNKQPYPYIIKNHSNFFCGSLLIIVYLLYELNLNKGGFPNKTTGPGNWGSVNKQSSLTDKIVIF
jgi:hypothetical protein